ncbi:MAG: 16S rRNA (cytidine(1402)-2'-O)-methyltransferase [Gemmatimonadales bacterium]|jgi:16S rRNA (cytidine1402-2'-O)-methyltransferase
MSESAGTLYLVATPIGNLADLSPRALDVLGSVPVVYAEDTRRTLKLVRHFDLQTRLVSLHEHNERERIGEVLEALGAGADVALVTDAGTPGVSDPGAALVRAVADAGHAVVPVPGPSAVLAALAASGFGADQFAFFGFPPRGGSERTAWLDRCRRTDVTVVAFESPNRVGRLLSDLSDAGLSGTPACVCRELTKVHEEVRRGTVAALADYYRGADVRGEVTLVLDRAHGEEADAAGPAAGAEAPGPWIRVEDAARGLARELAARGASTREITDALRRDLGMARNAAYETALAAAQGSGDDEGPEEGNEER